MLKKAVNGVKKAINAVKNIAKKIINAIKFFISPLGTIIGWILLIIFIIIMLSVLIKIGSIKLKEAGGENWNYSTYEEDIEVVKQLYQSGYENVIDAENFQDFKAFEYSVLIDAAEYLRIQSQNRFDICDNEGEYAFERTILKNKLGSEKYNKLIETLDKNYNNTENAAITFLNVGYTTNQELIGGKNSATNLETLMDASSNRNVKVEEVLEGAIESVGTVKGGNNRVTGPFLVYEFKAGNYKNNSELISSATGATTSDLFAADILKGSIIPYIYVVREDIKFSYYFDNNNKVIEYPLMLNAFNYNMNVGEERTKEVNRAGAKTTVVWPNQGVNYLDKDENGDGDYKKDNGYTLVPYCFDETTNIVYKIPLSTLLGRYMPKAELLQAWTILKEDVDQPKETEDLIDTVINGIKGIYNEACLLGEDIKEEVKVNKSGDVFKYANDTTNKKTFATFKAAGIESTEYGMNGLEGLDPDGKDGKIEDGKIEVKIVTDFVDGVVVAEEFEVRCIATVNGMTTEWNESFNTNDFGIDGVNRSKKVLGYGTPEDGYLPPSNLEGEEVNYSSRSVSSTKQNIIDAVENVILGYYEEDILNGSSVVVKAELLNADEVVKYNPVFVVEKFDVYKKLKIEHTRMPILLIDSVTTWARTINYTHTITQNSFKLNNKHYIIPKSVSSMGISGFSTTASEVYRYKAYKDIFARVKEKDVINMILQFETEGEVGANDSYEYMRDLYKLIHVSKEYSIANPEIDDNKNIHEDTFKYVYIPDSVLFYNDSQTQKIYWLDLLAAHQDDDAITKEELENVRTKDREITWQVVEYDKYPECNVDGTTKVYALNPFGSSYVRTYYETARLLGYQGEINGAYDGEGHLGADWYGRKWVDSILRGGDSIGGTNGICSKIYNYELNRLSSIYKEAEAKKKLQEELKEQYDYMPIVAVAPGEVSYVGYGSRSGFYVYIKHNENGNEIVTMYMHLKRWPLVNEGDYVGAGTLLGYEGNTGRSSGKHLHFQMGINGDDDSPAEYVFPSFNPFYYKEKSEEEEYNISSDYMSLYRTVAMIGSGMGRVPVEELSNQVPQKPLLDFNNLIQKQGTVEKTLQISMPAGNGGWNKDCETAEEFKNYLETNGFYDLYIEPACFDRDLALAQGYLDVHPDLIPFLLGSIVVKTDMAGGLPALTKEELIYILENWLVARYGDSKFNCPETDPASTNRGMTKVEWLWENVFTSDTIDTMLAAQETYKVSPVFMLAVATQECQMGCSDTELSKAPVYNIFSIKGTKNGGFIAPHDNESYNVYSSYADAFEGFARLIAESEHYFTQGRFTIGQIAPVYCDVGWGNGVASIALKIMQYYTGSGWSFPEGALLLWSGNNDLIVNMAVECFKWYSRTPKYEYCQDHDQTIPPYSGTPINGDFSNLPRGSKDTGCNAYTTDCSTYVSWALYEYANIIGDSKLAGLAKKCAQSGYYRDVGQYLYDGTLNAYDAHDLSTAKEFSKYFQLVWHYERDGWNEELMKSRIQPGDILAYHDGVGQGHVEFYVGEKAGEEASGISGTIILSSGTFAKNTLSINYNNRGPGLRCVLRPMPEGGFPNTGSLIRDFGRYDATGAEDLAKMASKCIQWLCQSQRGFSYPPPGASNVRLPYKEGKYSPGVFPNIDTPYPKYKDCTSYVSWVIYEYARLKGISEFISTDVNGNETLAMHRSPSQFQEIAYEIAIKNFLEYDYCKYIEVVWVNNSQNGSNGLRLGINQATKGYQKLKDDNEPVVINKRLTDQEIYSTIKPGDILIYCTTHTGDEKPGDGGSHHGEIFAGWVDSSVKKMYVYTINGKSSYDEDEYKEGQPIVRDLTKGLGLSDLTAVLRLTF